jgi:hypothetical protein
LRLLALASNIQVNTIYYLEDLTNRKGNTKKTLIYQLPDLAEPEYSDKAEIDGENGNTKKLESQFLGQNSNLTNNCIANLPSSYKRRKDVFFSQILFSDRQIE